MGCCHSSKSNIELYINKHNGCESIEDINGIESDPLKNTNMFSNEENMANTDDEKIQATIPASLLQLYRENKDFNANYRRSDGIEINPFPGPYKPRAYIIGPKHSPYEDGKFRIDIDIPNNNPTDQPIITFNTKIYHPNIGEDGRLHPGATSCVENNIRNILFSIRSLLTTPNMNEDFCLNTSAYETRRNKETLLKTSSSQESSVVIGDFDRIAREWTLKYAFDDYIPHYPKIKSADFDYDTIERCVRCTMVIDNGYGYDAQNMILEMKQFGESRIYFKETGILDCHQAQYTFDIPVDGSFSFWSAHEWITSIHWKHHPHERKTHRISKYQKEWMVVPRKEDGVFWINGYLRSCTRDLSVIIPMEIVNICNEYYYEWKLYIALKCGSHQREIRLNDTADIEKYQEMSMDDYKNFVGTTLNLSDSESHVFASETYWRFQTLSVNDLPLTINSTFDSNDQFQ